MKKLVVAVGWSMGLLLAGCATGPSVSESPDIEAVPPGMSRIVVYRSQVLGAAVQPTVHVDGREVGRCEPEGAFLVDVKPGAHVLSARTESGDSVDVTTRAGEVLYVECTIGIGVLVGHPKLTPVQSETGRKAVGDLSLTGRY